MGIFDDVIREHLDLKRRQGADEDELKQLEDEAFGLPTRPGEPDFPETGEAVTEAPTGAEAAVAAEPGDGEPAEAESQAGAEAVPEPRDEEPPHGDALLAESGAAPPEPTDEGPVEDAGAATFSTTEREAISEQPTEFFDHSPSEFELGELDLDLDEEIEELDADSAEGVPTPAADEPSVSEPEPGAEPEAAPPESEASIPEVSGEPDVEPTAPEDQAPSESAPPEQAAEAEDVLEETPEFLRDNPDDDELWFEQGEPKDFDF